MTTPARVRFAGYVLDPATRELLRGGTPVALSPKAFELLTMLVAERPKAISKHELQDRLWPATFVVEKNLANLVSEIRQALGDDPVNPRFVRTVHRFGYAFREAAPDTEGRSGHNLATVRLLWTEGRATLDDGENVIGRDPDAGVFLKSPGVSRRHACITIASGRATIDDLGSKNGTFVGDRRVDGPTPLSDGDVIGIGSIELTVRIVEHAGSTVTLPQA